MNKTSLAKLGKSIGNFTAKHTPEILTGFGIAGMITTTILAVKATPKALELLAEAREEKEDEPLTKLEVVKAAWKPYVPAAIVGVASTACLIGASTAGLKRTTALATAYKLSETALTEYKEKVIETIGEKKEKTVRHKVAKEKVEKDLEAKKEVVIVDGDDKLCYDVLSGRFFKSTIPTIERAVNEVNRQMLVGMGGYVSLNDFYDELDLPHTPVGDDLGWRIDKGKVEVEFDSDIAKDGTPYIILDYKIAPRYDYSKLM